MKVFFYEVIKTCKRTIFQTLLIISGFISLSITTTGFSMPIRYEGHGGPVMGLDTSIQKNLMASASFDYSVLLWEFNEIKEIKQLIGHDAAVNVAKFSKSENY